ncbi:VRR-NUC domain-containing protein [Kocuria rosea]|uniref:VRR-NUC domain-containing protein n=1 Tax=Kocuria rosea TaxID=1275 RepID=UPI003D34E4C4
MTTARDFMDQITLKWSEDQLQNHVLQLATVFGWRFHHETDSRRSRPGFPDLVLVHPKLGRVLWRELKSERGRVRPEQREWISDLQAAEADADIWRPRDVVSGRIEKELRP